MRRLKATVTGIFSRSIERRGGMKKIEAIIKPARLDEVRDALAREGFAGVTFAEVKGCGRQRGHTELYRGSEYVIDLLPKLRVEVVVDGSEVEHAISVIETAARTGKIGDGKIFVIPIDETLET